MNPFPIFNIERNTTDFPRLFQITDAPQSFYFQGRPEARSLLHELPARGLAVVGTRNPQLRSCQEVKKVISKVKSGLVILSGLARGIDAAAHEAALASGLPTIAILGGGFEKVYPRENRALLERIMASGGLVASEFPPSESPKPHYFLLRNRIIAGWSQASWIVEASFESGAMSTARWARDQDRTVFATPCFPGDPYFTGNQKLLDQDCCWALWSSESLKAEWLSLDLHPMRTRKRKSSRIEKFVREQTIIQGSVRLADILDHPNFRTEPAAELIRELETLIAEKRIFEKNGFFLST